MKSIKHPTVLCFLLAGCFLVSSCDDEEDPDPAARYIGSYSATARENFEQLSRAGIRKDTAYTNLFVSIFRNGQDKKKLSITMILPSGKQLRRNLKVTATEDSLYDYFVDSTCQCTANIVGKLKGKNLEMSLYNYKYDLDKHLKDAFLTVEAFKY